MSKVKRITECAFEGCSSLSSVKLLSEGDLYIGARAFYDCYDLEAITIPAGVTSLEGSYRYHYPVNENGAMVGDGFKYADGYQFEGTNAEILFEPDSKLRILGEAALSGASSLVDVEFPNVEEIAKSSSYVLANCPNLKSVSFPSLKRIGLYSSGAFKGSPLENLDMPALEEFYTSFVTSISSPDFTLVLPETVTYVWYLDSLSGWEANFKGTVMCKAVTPPKVSHSVDNTINLTLKIPAESLEVYKAHEQWGKFATILPI